MRVAFIGIGNMGRPKVRNLIHAGHTVFAYDLSVSALDEAVRLGAHAAVSPQGAATEADVVISMLPTGQNVRELYLGPDGLVAKTRAGTLLIDSSTISSTVSSEIAAEARAAGKSMIDAPVSGGTPGAEAGTLTFMVGGSAEDLERARPLLEAMGKRIFHVGGNGAGHTAKLCNNMLSGVCMAATAEALALGVANGLDPAVLSEVMRNSSGTNYALERYHPYPGIMPNVPSSHGYQGGFRSEFQLKDMRLAKQLSAEYKSLSPLGDLACDLFALHCQSGNGHLDYGSIIKMMMKVPEAAAAGAAGEDETMRRAV